MASVVIGFPAATYDSRAACAVTELTKKLAQCGWIGEKGAVFRFWDSRLKGAVQTRGHTLGSHVYRA